MSLSDAELAARLTGIGSSEAAAVCGLHPSLSSLQVWMSKVLGAKKKRSEEMDFGHDMEPAIVSYRARQLGAAIVPQADYGDIFGARVFRDQEGKPTRTVRHPEYQVALATLDSLLEVPGEERIGGRSPLRICEAKNVSWHQSGEWGDDDEDAPAHYTLQCVWQLGVTGMGKNDLCASIGGSPPSAWGIAWNDGVRRTFENMLTICERFWHDNVLKKVPPAELDHTDDSAEYLRLTYPRERYGVLPKATAEIETLAIQYDWLGAQEATLKEEKQQARNRLCQLLGDHAGAVLSDGRRVTWLWQGTEAKATRVLRVSKLKEARK
jgi:predicted phage-related endonuclease